MGSVMEFNDGQNRKVIILDAKYRANRRFGACGLDVDLPNTNVGYHNYYFDLGNSGLTPSQASKITDITLNKYFDGINNPPKDPNTSKYNCDVWMTKNNIDTYRYYDNNNIVSVKGVPAVAYCRSIDVLGKPCDLPNINIASRIYCDAETIDSLDPTIVDYPKYALGSKNPQGEWYIGIAGSGDGYTTRSFIYYMCTSTKYNSSSNRIVMPDGYIQLSYKDAELSVCPVLEL